MFSITAFLLLGLADLAVWGGYQGVHPREQFESTLWVHAGILAAVFLFALLGSLVAFLTFKHRLPSLKVAILGGAVFAFASFFALVAVFGIGGAAAAGVWLLLGSALIAGISCAVGRHHVG